MHSRVEQGLDLIAGVLRVELVHDVQEGGKIIVRRPVAVHVVVGNESDVFLREKHFRVEANLQLVSPKSAHVLDNDRPDLARFDFL